MVLLSSYPLLFEMPGGGELLIILVAVLLLFGGKKIPELMRGLGRGIREFNDAKSSVTKELNEGMQEPPARHNSNPADTKIIAASNINASSTSTSNND